jgi:Papain family cysteine protease
MVMAPPTLATLGKFGWLEDPPKAAGNKKPDFIFKRDKFTPNNVPDLYSKLKAVHSGDVDLSPHGTQSHQYKAGSCAGNATADSVEILNSIEGRPHVQLSRLFVYTLARNFMDLDYDGRSDIDKDDGTYIRLCFDVLSKFGICREDIEAKKGGWPYIVDRYGNVDNLDILPGLKSMRKATGHRIHSYYRITATGNDRLDEIVAALRANHPVVFGTLVDSAFIGLRNKGPVGVPSGKIEGGHAMIIVGYLTGIGFIVKNSWGKDWGEFGLCIVKPEYLKWEKTRDIWVPTTGVTF